MGWAALAAPPPHKLTTMHKLKRPVALGLLVIMLAPGIASALLPLALGIGLRTGILTDAMATAGLRSLSVHLGALAAGIVLTDQLSDPNAAPDPSQAIATVMVDPKKELPKRPAGYSDPQPGSVQPTPPSTVSPSAQMRYSRLGGSTTVYSLSRMAACQEYVAWDSYAVSAVSVADHQDAGQFRCYYTTPTGGQDYAKLYEWSVNVCPTGYTASGSTCLLSNAAAVQKPSDNHCTIMRVGNTFTGDPLDPDCSSPPSDPKDHVVISQDGTIVTAMRADGTKTTIQIKPDGITVLESTSPSADGKSTEKDTITIGAPDAVTGKAPIIGKKNEKFEGQGVDASATASTAPVFDKSGLSTEATTQGIKSELEKLNNETYDGTRQGVESNKLDTHEATILGNMQTLTSGSHGFTWDWVPSVPSSGGCVNPEFKGSQIDICSAAGLIRQALSWLVYIFGSFMLFNILTGRRET